MKNNILYIGFILIAILTACQDLYLPEIDEYPDALVVEGMLTDQNEYVKVKLTRSASFNDASYYANERKAVVSIETSGGMSYATSEVSAGVYQTNEPVPTVVGEAYFLRVITSDGEEYHSEPEQMMPPTTLDNIILTDSVFRDLTYNYYGEPVVSDYSGITFSIRPVEPDGGDYGFLYKWNALVNYSVSSALDANNWSYFCWDELWSNTIYVYDYLNDGYLSELPVGDLHSLSYYTLGPLPIDSSRFEGEIKSIATRSFYYHLHQYTITRNGAKYWKSVKNQSETSGKLFDPVEEQICGNMVCVTNSLKPAFGYFNVASYSDKILAVEVYRETHGEIRVVDIMPVAPSDEDCFLSVRPDFWLEF